MLRRQRLAAQAVEDHHRARDARRTQLVECLAGGVEGFTFADGSQHGIAARLVVTEGAVEKHTQRIFAKIGLGADEGQHRRVAAVLTFLRG